MISKKHVMINITYGALSDSGYWVDFCMKYGVNEWCMNEGLANKDTKGEITLDDAQKWGLVEK